MPNPEISVVIAVYNGAQELAATLDSILGQQGCDFEVVAIDDGSTDGSAALLDASAAIDARMRVLHQPNQGLTRALMKGCEAARGEFIARHDVGDASLPGRLAAQAGVLRANPALAFVACRHVLTGPAGEALGDPAPDLADVAGGLRTPAGAYVAAPAHGSVMFRKEAYRQAGGYRAEFYFAQDVDLWSRLLEHGEMAWMQDVLYRMRFDLGGITAGNRDSQQRLRALVDEATELRRAGRGESQLLARAAAIRPGTTAKSANDVAMQRAAAAYFVGSCLARRNDARGRTYLRESLRLDPVNVKAWFKLFRLSLASREGPR